ncbi:insulinase family protein, partial [Alistipes putredinis]|nr:insulinase family protein [Alistipes putredinis]
ENNGIIYKRQGEDPSVQKIAKPALTPIQMNRDTQSAFLTEIQNSTVTPIEPVFVDFNRDMEIFKTDSSLEVLYKTNDINDLFSLTYLFDTGVLNDPAINNAFA